MPTFGIMANPHKQLFKEQFSDILSILKEAGVNVICSKNIGDFPGGKQPTCQFLDDTEIPPKCDMIFAFGGDGTMLRTIQVVGQNETPVLGVNVGGLGFLTEVPLEGFDKNFRTIVDGNYHIEERMILEGVVEGHKKPMYALNEFAIEKGRSTNVIEVSMEIDGKAFNDYVADGLIISTPTGSTGYSLSSGGPIVVPTSQCMILNPICPHSLTNRPVIIPSESKLSMKIYTDYPEVIITADNQDIREVPNRTQLKIQQAPYTARLVKCPGSDYFSLLRNKLSWGEDFRNKLRWSHNR